MKADTRKTLQVILVIGLILAAARLIFIYRSRHQSAAPAIAQQAPLLNPTYYVVPKKLYPYDLKSARQLTQQPVWVKEGYRYFYYAYDPVRRRSDFKHEAGLLGPIEKLDIKDVTTDVAPVSRQKQVIAIFEKDGKSYSVPIGAMKGSDYQIYSDEMFFVDDPRQLYHVWPKDVWDSIEKHEVKLGMDEIQASLALGMGVPQRQDDPDIKTVNYPNGGKPLEVTYRGGKAAEVKPGPAT